LDTVRAEAAAVADVATFVRVDEAAIRAYAPTLPLAQARAPELDASTHYLADPDGTLAFLVTLDAINFGSGYFPRLRKRIGMSGYFTVAASLKDEYERNGPLSASALAAISIDDCTRMFGQPSAEPDVQELMALFAQALNDLGRYLEGFDGSFARLVEAAQGSAERLAGVLVGMPFYRDVALYHERQVPFYKRAQLTAADLSIAGVARFTDLDRLTIFADNLVPHVLRMDGILHYDPDLLERINREELIVPGSAEEVEIRACAVHAVELIAHCLRRDHGEPVTAMQLDYVLWNRGQASRYKAVPRHRARTVYY
jgi:Potential Queuosine, Q, salvage protein family